MSRQHTLLLQPRDPLIARDARPFTNAPGGRANTLPWPLPQTVAGALRTHIGNAQGLNWEDGGPEQARTWALKGPLLAVQREQAWLPYLPKPRDAFLLPTEADADRDAPRRAFALRPIAEEPADGGYNLPTGMRPIQIPEEAAKPDADAAQFWSLQATLAWLADSAPTTAPSSVEQYAALPKDTRVHVGIDRATLLNREGVIFTTEGLAFADGPLRQRPQEAGDDGARPGTALLCRVSAPNAWEPHAAFLALGGERRVTNVTPVAADMWPDAKQATIATWLNDLAQRAVRRLRLQLATPAIFRDGWWPDGIDQATRILTIPDWPNGETVRLRLVGAIIDRPQPISGWALNRQASDRQGGGLRFGPKATRYAVPAGCVYFLEVDGDEPLALRHLETLWLRSICGYQQDRVDGYGLVLPGCW